MMLPVFFQSVHSMQVNIKKLILIYLPARFPEFNASIMPKDQTYMLYQQNIFTGFVPDGLLSTKCTGNKGLQDDLGCKADKEIGASLVQITLGPCIYIPHEKVALASCKLCKTPFHTTLLFSLYFLKNKVFHLVKNVCCEF